MKVEVWDNKGMSRFRGSLAVFFLVLFSGCKEELVDISPQEVHKSTGSATKLQWGSGRAAGKNTAYEGAHWHLKALNFSGESCTENSKPRSTIGVSDSGLDSAHSQLNTSGAIVNFLGKSNIDPNPELAKSEGDHGTSVGGIIGAKCTSETRSIFPDFPLGGMNLLAPEVLAHPNINNFFLTEPTYDFRIVNQSWGSLPPFFLQESLDSEYFSNVREAAQKENRVFIKAAGNQWPQDAAYDPQNQSPYIMVIAASNKRDAPASFSQAGANLWVTAPGEGIATLEATAKIPNAAKGEKKYYNQAFSGTSAAAPMVTGVVALMLERNPELTWRDIKYILARTSTRVGTSGWTTNRASFDFSRDYGFGLVNASEAVKWAECALSSPPGNLTCNNRKISLGSSFTEQHLGSQSPSLSIPDNQEEGITSSINTTQNLTIEALELTLNITHQFPSDLLITLTSPSGTEAIILEPHPDFYTRYPHMRNIRLMVNHFYGETTKGKWTLKISDRWEEDAGTLESWSLKAYGH